MIRTKEDLRRYMEADKRMLERGVRPGPVDYVWKFEQLLRRSEYWHNRPKTPLTVFLGQVSLATAGAHGSSAWVLDPAQRLRQRAQHRARWPYRRQPLCAHRQDCRIHVGVNIGTRAGVPDEAPSIGDDVYIGPGAKLFGRIEVADRIAVGANAVVNKSFGEPGVSIGGVPAKKISDKGNPDYKGGKPE